MAVLKVVISISREIIQSLELQGGSWILDYLRAGNYFTIPESDFSVIQKQDSKFFTMWSIYNLSFLEIAYANFQ